MAIHDGNEFARFGCELLWLDGHDPAPLLKQQLLIEMKPLDEVAWTMELQSTFTPSSDELELQQTNFGFLAVRVSRQIAEYWGGGKLTNSELATSEKNIFGKPAKWMDYSGTQYSHSLKKEVQEGITYNDHGKNVGQPTGWHVREDGWMGAAPGMKMSINLQKKLPLTLRYLLYVHPGPVDPEKTNQLYDEFSKSKALEAKRSGKKHTHLEISRVK